MRRAHPADTNLRPMSSPLGEETLATSRPCRSRSTTSQRTLTPAVSASRAANDIVPRAISWPRHQNVWSSSGASMPCNLRCVPDRPKTAPRRPKLRSRAQWESRVKCELLHTGRPPSSDILALCRTAPYGESRLNLGSLDASVRAIAGRRSRVERLVAPLPGRKGLSRGLHGEHDGCCGTGI